MLLHIVTVFYSHNHAGPRKFSSSNKNPSTKQNKKKKKKEIVKYTISYSIEFFPCFKLTNSVVKLIFTVFSDLF